MDGAAGFAEGLADAVIGTVEGIFNMVAHPIQTIQGIVYVATHPVDVAVGIWNAVSESWNNDIVNGDAESRGKWFGRMVGEIALSVVGTKGVDKVAKIAKGTTIVKEAGGIRIIRGGAKEKVKVNPSPPKPPKPDLDLPDTLTIKTIQQAIIDNGLVEALSSIFKEGLNDSLKKYNEIEQVDYGQNCH